jgi:hypothetical protein
MRCAATFKRCGLFVSAPRRGDEKKLIDAKTENYVNGNKKLVFQRAKLSNRRAMGRKIQAIENLSGHKEPFVADATADTGKSAAARHMKKGAVLSAALFGETFRGRRPVRSGAFFIR